MPEPVTRSRAASTVKRSKPVRRKKKRRLLLLFTLFALLLVGGTAGALYWHIDKALQSATSGTGDGVNTLLPGTDTAYHSDKPLSIVLLGRDTRKETGSLNTDVMIVSVINPVTKKVTMVSIPRDTRVKIPGYRGYHKINSVYANGEAERRQAEANGQTPTENGVTLTKKTLEQVLGIPIQYYVEVDFEGFKTIIDELGGVEVNVDRKLQYDDPTDGTHIDLEPGLQLLNGEQALGYVRHRHDNRGLKYFSTDFDRNRRQQEVIKALVDKMTSFDGVTKIFRVIEIASEHVKTDMSPDQIKGLVYDFKGINSSSIVTLDNGAYWNPSLGYTFIPQENRDAIRAALQTEMGISAGTVAELNDSITEGGARDTEEAIAVPQSSKKRRTTEAAQETPGRQETTESVKKTQKTTAENKPAAPDTGGKQDQQPTAPPPDIVAPAQPETDQPEQQSPEPPETTTPPPDIVPPKHSSHPPNTPSTANPAGGSGADNPTGTAGTGTTS